MMTTSEKQYKILVVDDSSAIRSIMKRELENRGYQVTTVEDGALAVEAFKKEKPDLITLDVHMPNMDGFQACAAIRSSVGGLEIPIVFLTGNDTLEDRDRGFTLGAIDFVSKYSAGAWKEAADVVDKVLAKDKKLAGSLALVISTSDITLGIIASSLSRYGVEVLQGTTDDEAVRIIYNRRNELDMVVIDFTTVNLDCFKICDVIRNHVHLHDIPVVLLVGEVHRGLVLEMYQAGATDQIRKPFTQEELRAKLITHLEAQSLFQKLGREAIKNKMILEVAGEGVVGVGPDGIINFINKAASNMIDLPIGEFVSRRFSDFFAVDINNPKDLLIPHFQKRNEGRSVFHKATGGILPVHFIAAPIMQGDVNFGGVIVFNDITDSLRREKIKNESIKKMEQEMQAAGLLQESLLPKKADVAAVSGLDIAFFTKARSPVSGDFLIIEELLEDKVAVLVIDVMGHGVKAGLATIRMKTLFDELKRKSQNPVILIEKMNEKAFTLIENGLFQTVLLAVFDMEQNEVTIGSAGGVPPLYYSTKDGTSALLAMSGNPVGITTGDNFEVDWLKMPFLQGDTLILQTDGTIECTNEEGTAFDQYLAQEKGKVHLGKSKKSQEIVDDLLADAIDFIGGDLFDDDVTVVVVQKE